MLYFDNKSKLRTQRVQQSVSHVISRAHINKYAQNSWKSEKVAVTFIITIKQEFVRQTLRYVSKSSK